MEAVGFYLFYGFSWVITLLPLPVLYIFSDLLYAAFYYLPGYRRKVVRENLINSFPEKELKEIILIEKAFYHHLCDVFIETIKLLHMSNRELMNRMCLLNPELFDRLYDEKRDVALVMGHYGNWEWSVCLPFYMKYTSVPIYKPLANKHFDKFMVKLRSRSHARLTPMADVVREIITLKREKRLSNFGFISDQTPPRPEIKYWTKFLNQDTPVYLGVEKLAMKYNLAVVFLNVQNVRRGYYTVTGELLVENPTGMPEHAITEAHVRRLEEVIKGKPEQWVWSHRRWKYKKEDFHG